MNWNQSRFGAKIDSTTIHLIKLSRKLKLMNSELGHSDDSFQSNFYLKVLID